MNQGIYILLMELPKSRRIQIGRLGALDFPRGLYAYAGSAQNGLEARIARHKRRAKKLFWHIDYFLEKARMLEAYVKISGKAEECRTAQEFSKRFKSIPKFGCSDCKCRSHLFLLGR